MTAVTVQPRDVTFTFTDSCNCCFLCVCCKKTYAKEDDVYVNSEGDLEEFNGSKAKKSIEDAFERAKTHLFESLKQRITAFEGSPEEFYEKAKGVLESIEVLRKINVAHIDSINDLMLEYLTSKTGEK